jgi:hypothetical protein
MQLTVVDSLERVAPAAWDALAGDANPFTCHAFLAALERNGCLGDAYGWWPHHLLVHEGERLVGACPLYLKNNSYGEFVFDWAWADAYQRNGLEYYPKLVCGVPYTPAAGPRLLVAPDADRAAVLDLLVAGAREVADRTGASSLHWLFTDEAVTGELVARDHLHRVGVQFHWDNPGYRDFQDYLDALTAKRRKEVRRERRLAMDTGVEIEVLDGHQADDAVWETYHRFYRDTFDRKWGIPTLSAGFFKEIGRTLADRVVLVMARHQGEYVAGAFNLAGTDTLYGRHWGAVRELPYVHFEVCYYRAIDHCIDRGLGRFEAGAQGEHKIARGFLPRATHSAHWIRHPGFREAIAKYLERERADMAEIIEDLGERSPYRRADA